MVARRQGVRYHGFPFLDCCNSVDFWLIDRDYEIMKKFVLAFVATLSLTACTAQVASGPATPSTGGVLGPTIIDEKAINLAFSTLETLATVSKSLVATGMITPGSVKALAIADGLEKTLAFLQAASTAQRAGNTNNYLKAISEAQRAYTQVQAALAL
jgi:hypothetical protein